MNVMVQMVATLVYTRTDNICGSIINLKRRKTMEEDNFKCTHYCEGECTLYRLSICEMAAFGDDCPDYEPSKDE